MSKKRRTIIKVSLPLTPLKILKARLMRSVQEADERRGGVRDYTKKAAKEATNK